MLRATLKLAHDPMARQVPCRHDLGVARPPRTYNVSEPNGRGPLLILAWARQCA